MAPVNIFYYVSSHGFGHATRSAEVIAEMERIHPQVITHVRSAAPAQIFLERCRNITIHPCRCDVGVVQPDGTRMDIPATARACRRMWRTFPRLLEEELSAARKLGISLVVSDIPPFAFRVSHALNLPGVTITNFSWDWIYQEWIGSHPEFQPLVETIQADYRKCSLLLQLPFSQTLPAFETVERIPMIGRKARLPRDTVRKILDLDPHKPAILLSFGGMGLNCADLAPLADLTDYQFISIGQYGAPGITMSFDAFHLSGVRYPDLVGAVDVVVSKPGYGIVSECAANGTRMLFTDRGPFREYDVLVTEMQDHIPVVHLPGHRFRSGDWEPELSRLIAMPRPVHTTPADGATIAAERVLSLAEEVRP